MFPSLLDLTDELGIDVEFWDFEPPLEAVYFSVPGAPPTIGLSNRLLRDPTLFRCVLAEEIGHHFTTVGDALPKTYFHYAQGLTVSRAEYRAWRWAAQYLIPLPMLKECLHNGINEVWELADYFDVTEQMMKFRLSLPEFSEVFK